MTKKIFSIFIIICILICTGCSATSETTTDTRKQEVLTYAKEIEDYFFNFSHSLLNLKDEFENEKDYKEQIVALDETISWLEKLENVDPPKDYKDIHGYLEDAVKSLIIYYKVEKSTFEALRDSYHDLDESFISATDILLSVLNEIAKKEKVTNKEKIYAKNINTAISVDNLKLKIEAINILSNIAEFEPPEEYESEHMLFKEEVKKLENNYTIFINSIKNQDEVLTPISKDMKNELMKLLTVYGDITQKIDKEYPGFYTN